MKKRVKVLWLPAWFPSKNFLLDGDFVERHAKAASIYSDIILLYAVKDEVLTKKKYYIEVEEQNSFTIYRGYYNFKCRVKIIEKLITVILFYVVLFKLYQKAISDFGIFDLVHVHIAQKQSLFAFFLKCFKRYNYVVTEHNGWFMPIGEKRFTKNIILKWIIKLHFKYASNTSVVSKSLGIALQKKYSVIKSFLVIPNAVDDSIFFYKPQNEKTNDINFFAITGNFDIKNIDGIIRAFSNFIKKGYTATLHIAGANDSAFKLLVDELLIAHSVKFYGLLDNKGIARLMQTVDAFIFFTRYETFGCVMAEAICCGKPVIASRLDVLKENLKENSNALFVTSENENELTAKLMYYCNNKNAFDNNKIAENATDKFNFDRIGKDFLAFYKTVITKP
jgi:glycosyltransferase involved in cell wall biosynthesis